ncbi:hypothetical protein ILYODFUR_027695, partial [Ilyodon furcidens]
VGANGRVRQKGRHFHEYMKEILSSHSRGTEEFVSAHDANTTKSWFNDYGVTVLD